MTNPLSFPISSYITNDTADRKYPSILKISSEENYTLCTISECTQNEYAPSLSIGLTPPRPVTPPQLPLQIPEALPIEVISNIDRTIEKLERAITCLTKRDIAGFLKEKIPPSIENEIYLGNEKTSKALDAPSKKENIIQNNRRSIINFTTKIIITLDSCRMDLKTIYNPVKNSASFEDFVMEIKIQAPCFFNALDKGCRIGRSMYIKNAEDFYIQLKHEPQKILNALADRRKQILENWDFLPKNPIDDLLISTIFP